MNIASLGLYEKWLSRWKKWHLRGYGYAGDKEAKDCLEWHTSCFNSQDFQAMGSGFVITINASLSFPTYSNLSQIAKFIQKQTKKLGDIPLYFGTSESLKLRSEQLEWFVLV